MKKQTKRERGCGIRNTKKNRKKRRQTRKVRTRDQNGSIYAARNFVTHKCKKRCTL